MTIIPFEGDFHVHDRATLTWYVRRVAAKQAEIETVRAQGAAIVKELQRDLDQLELLYAAQARAVLERLLFAKRGNSQHLKTLWGNISVRTTPARLTVRDAAQTLEWARGHAPEIVETTINRLALTRRFTATPAGLIVNGDGEPLEIPGVTVRAGEQRLYVKTPAAPSSSDDLT